MEEKQTKEKFHKIVRESIQFVEKHHVSWLSAKCRRYMMVYKAYNSNKDPLTYEVRKHFVKMVK